MRPGQTRPFALPMLCNTRPSNVKFTPSASTIRWRLVTCRIDGCHRGAADLAAD